MSMSQWGSPLDFGDTMPAAQFELGERVTVARHGRLHEGIVTRLHPECAAMLLQIDDPRGSLFLMVGVGDVLAVVTEN